jgi:hypothetical protein
MSNNRMPGVHNAMNESSSEICVGSMELTRYGISATGGTCTVHVGRSVTATVWPNTS